MRIRLLLLFFAFAFLIGCDAGSTNNLAPADLPAQTAMVNMEMPFDPVAADALARQLVVEQNWPGLSIAVGWRGDLVWAHAVGFADILEVRLMSPDSRLRIGSVTQAATGALLASLVRDGLVDLDEPINRYLPKLPERYAGMTTRALMQHSARVRHHTSEQEYLRRQDCKTTEAQLAVFISDPLVGERKSLLDETQELFASEANPDGQQPADAFSYSVYGWVLAAAVAEAAADASYYDLLKQRVLNPMAMTATGFEHHPVDASFYWPRMATTTRYGLEHASFVDLSCVAPGSGLLSTPTDLVNLGNALLTSALPDSEQARDPQPPGTDSDFGLGWQQQRIDVDGKPVTFYSHGGHLDGARWMGPGVPGGTASLIMVPEYRLVMAVATNVTFARELQAFNQALATTFIQALGK